LDQGSHLLDLLFKEISMTYFGYFLLFARVYVAEIELAAAKKALIETQRKFTFDVNGVTFLMGDIVERHKCDLGETGWRYWTTIQNQEDANKAVALGTIYYRVVRGPDKVRVL
jgi:hypothetical protein